MEEIIKFRARIKEAGKPKMFYQDSQYLNSFLRRVTSFLAFEHDGEDGRHESYLENYALEKCLDQYTGLKDKNGKAIYTNDIVKYTFLQTIPENGSLVLLVSFNEGGFILAKMNSEPLTLREAIKSSNKADGLEVIGNIHENPDLLSELTIGEE